MGTIRNAAQERLPHTPWTTWVFVHLENSPPPPPPHFAVATFQLVTYPPDQPPNRGACPFPGRRPPNVPQTSQVRGQTSTMPRPHSHPSAPQTESERRTPPICNPARANSLHPHVAHAAVATSDGIRCSPKPRARSAQRTRTTSLQDPVHLQGARSRPHATRVPQSSTSPALSPEVANHLLTAGGATSRRPVPVADATGSKRHSSRRRPPQINHTESHALNTGA